MKKGTVIVLALVLLLAFAGCGNETESPGQSAQRDSSTVAETDKAAMVVPPTQNDILQGRTYQVPTKQIYMETPDYQEIEEGYTSLFIIHNTKYVAITAARRESAANVNEAHEKAFAKFKQNMTAYEGGVNGITMTKEETQTVNGIEFYTYEGKIHYGVANKYDGYAIGCAFVMDGIPCEIVGSVVDPSQSEEMIEEIRSVVQAMMQSVRATP